MLKAVFSAIILLLIPLSWVMGQHFESNQVYTSYSVIDGLPSNECYDVFQDSKGYLWVTGDKGVSRFDGYKFENFTTADGLSDNTVFKATEDDQGRIWFATLSGKLCYFESDTFKIFEHNDTISKYLTGKITNFWWADGYLVIGGNRLTNLFINDFGEYKVGSATIDKPKIRLSQYEIDERRYFVLNFSDTSFNLQDVPRSAPRYVGLGDDGGVLSLTNTLYFYSKEGAFTGSLDIGNLIGDLSVHGEDLYISCWNAVFRLSLKDHKLEEILRLDNTAFTGTWLDVEGMLWITTNQYGCFAIYPNLEGQVSDDDAHVLNLVAPDRYLVVPHHTISSLMDNQSYRVYNQKYVRFSEDESDISPHGFRTIANDADNTYAYLGASSNIYKLNKTSVERKMFVFSDPTRILALHLQTDSLLWIGTTEGLFYTTKLDTPGITTPQAAGEAHLLKQRVQDIKVIQDRYLIVATRGNGLYVFDGSEIVLTVTENDGLLSNVINHLFVNKRNELLVATNKGVSKLKFKSDFNSYELVTLLTKSNGLRSPDVLQVVEWNEKLFLGFSHGTQVFDLKKMSLASKKYIPPRIEYIVVGGELHRDIPESIYVDPGNKDVEIAFIGITLADPGNVSYRYRLIGLDDNWSYTKDRTVRYSALPAGTYNFQLEAQQMGGNWRATSGDVEIVVGQFYWQTTGFQLLVLILVVICVLLILRWYYSNRERRNQHRIQLNEYERQAIGAQMNPHFIFNSLNAIQDFILRNESEMAGDYLARFARLIRFTFENNKSSLIPLADEVKALELYLKLESLRFEDRFEYEIAVGDSIEKEKCMVPTLLVQPLVENAIKHGKIHTFAGGRIRVSFIRKKEVLHVIVEDNGAGGVDLSQTGKDKVLRKQKSSGLQMSRKRIDLVNRMARRHSDFALQSEPGEGTRISFSIPYQEKQLEAN